ncbi:MAG: YceH family protein [Pseudomonadota bacterium]
MDMVLTPEEVRVLGSLMEKELATPEYYPLSFNALVNACNQKSNRSPVVAYTDDSVLGALEGLIKKDIVFQSNVSRVPKYEELIVRRFGLVPREAAVLCILFLRGDQTPGEVRIRTERMYAFNDLDDVVSVMDEMIDSGYIEKLPRKPGHKEVRYRQLFSDHPADRDSGPAGWDLRQQEPVSPAAPVNDERLEALERQVEILSQQVDELTRAFERFRSQFE